MAPWVPELLLWVGWSAVLLGLFLLLAWAVGKLVGVLL